MDSPSILAPVIVDEAICAQAAKTSIYVDEVGKSHTLSNTNSVLHYKYISHGSMSYTSSNVYCEGGTSKIMGEDHTGVLELRTVRFEIRQTTVALRSDGRIQDTLDSEELPSSCRNNAACSTISKTYYFTSPPEVCPYKKIRTIEAELVTGHIKGKERKMLIANVTKILVPITNTALPAPTACTQAFRTIVPTDFPLLSIVFIEDIVNLRALESVAGADISLDLEERVTDSYIEYHAKKELEKSLVNLGVASCRMSQNSWLNEERSVFHEGQILRKRGEIIQELRCSRVQVVVTIGDHFNSKCYFEAIPVRYGSEHLLLTAGSRTLVEIDEISVIPCSSVTAPMFVTKGNKVIVADPLVRLVDIKLSHDVNPLFNALYSSDHDDEDQIFTELLYSPDEIQSFSEFLSFNRIRAAASLQLVGDYCSSEGDHCGSFNPSSSYDFNLEQITDAIPNPWRQFWQVMDKIQTIGGYAGFLFLLYFVYDLIAITWKTIKNRFSGFNLFDSYRMARNPHLPTVDRDLELTYINKSTLNTNPPLQASEPLLRYTSPPHPETNPSSSTTMNRNTLSSLNQTALTTVYDHVGNPMSIPSQLINFSSESSVPAPVKLNNFNQ